MFDTDKAPKCMEPQHCEENKGVTSGSVQKVLKSIKHMQKNLYELKYFH